MLDALLLPRVPIVGWIEVQQPEGAVGDRGGEEVRPEHVVEAVLRRLRAVGVELHAEGFDVGGVRLPQSSGQPFQGLALTAAGVENPENLVAAGVAGRRLDELRDQVGHSWRRRVEAAFCLCCEPH